MYKINRTLIVLELKTRDILPTKKFNSEKIGLLTRQLYKLRLLRFSERVGLPYSKCLTPHWKCPSGIAARDAE